MTDDSAVPKPLSDPAIAVAEEGLVILDGPAGLAITMTAQAAAGTGRSLIDAAAQAEQQQRSGPDAADPKPGMPGRP